MSATAGGITLPSHDLDGRPLFTQDAYGTVGRVFYDLAGRTVRTVAAFADGVASDNDTNIVTDTVYNLNGGIDTAITGRDLTAAGGHIDTRTQSVRTTYDALGRALTVTAIDGTTAISDALTVYDKAGRTVRSSGSAPVGTPATERVWTATSYDALGRAYRTVSHADTTGAFHYEQAAFEGAPIAKDGATTLAPGWANTGTLLTGGASTLSLDTIFHPVAARSGAGRLHIANGAVANRGATWTLPGTFKTGTTYRLRGFIRATTGAAVEAYLGCADATCRVQVPSASGAWQEVTTAAHDPGVQERDVGRRDRRPAARGPGPVGATP